MAEVNKEIYKGQIYDGDESGLCVGTHGAIAEEIEGDMERYGNFLSVKYWVAQQEITPETVQLDWFKQIYTGEAEADYDIAYSDYTGYLWTDEEVTVGGHDLIQELYSHEGKYLYMEIEYSKETPEPT